MGRQRSIMIPRHHFVRPDGCCLVIVILHLHVYHDSFATTPFGHVLATNFRTSSMTKTPSANESLGAVDRAQAVLHATERGWL